MVSVFPTAYIEAAQLVAKSDVLDDLAERVKAHVQRQGLRHRLTGAFGRSVTVTKLRGKHGVEDRFIYSSDPGAQGIEFGHYVHVRDQETGDMVKTNVHVPGKFIFTNAARSFQ